MNTWRVCAALGLGLSLAAFGCGSSSSKNDGGSGGRDGGRDAARDTAAGTSCTYNGTTYQPGESFTINCVRFTCVSGNNVTSSGSPCSTDAPITPADTRSNADAAPDVPAPTDVRADGNRDGAGPDEAHDVRAGEVAGGEAGAVDVAPADTRVELDVQAPPDLAPVQCTYGGQKYGVGVPFPCACNTCKCDSAGTIQLVTNNDCTIDAS